MNAQLPHWLRALVDRCAFWLLRQKRPVIEREPFPDIRASHIAHALIHRGGEQPSGRE